MPDITASLNAEVRKELLRLLSTEDPPPDLAACLSGQSKPGNPRCAGTGRPLRSPSRRPRHSPESRGLTGHLKRARSALKLRHPPHEHAIGRVRSSARMHSVTVDSDARFEYPARRGAAHPLRQVRDKQASRLRHISPLSTQGKAGDQVSLQEPRARRKPARKRWPLPGPFHLPPVRENEETKGK